MTGDVTPYASLITNEHADKPKFMATIVATVQPYADQDQNLDALATLYDLDNAVGDQLDKIGLWIGRSRFLKVPVPSVFFSFDISGLGFDQGVWKGPYDPTTGVVALDDTTYRLYLRATAAANNWDGTIPGMYSVYLPLLAPYGAGITVTDNQDMTFTLAFTGTPLPPIIKAMFRGQYITLIPAGMTQIGP